MKPVIAVADLAALIEQDAVLVVDCRKELSAQQSGRLAYAQAHIPGALYADLDSDLSDLSKRGLGRHPLPDESAFGRVLASWGWTPGRKLVAYDDAGGALAAARLWWMLRLVGAREAAVLDGGWAAWLDAGGRVEAQQPAPVFSQVEIKFDECQMVGYETLQAGLADGSICLLDARGAPRFRGEIEPLDAVAGHVPGARNRPYSDNLDGSGRFRPAADLASDFLGLIAGFSPQSVVHMCGSGVTACHNLLAMEQAGLHGSRLFAPSWSGWISDPTRAISGVGQA